MAKTYVRMRLEELQRRVGTPMKERPPNLIRKEIEIQECLQILIQIE